MKRTIIIISVLISSFLFFHITRAETVLKSFNVSRINLTINSSTLWQYNKGFGNWYSSFAWQQISFRLRSTNGIQSIRLSVGDYDPAQLSNCVAITATYNDYVFELQSQPDSGHPVAYLNFIPYSDSNCGILDYSHTFEIAGGDYSDSGAFSTGRFSNQSLGAFTPWYQIIEGAPIGALTISEPTNDLYYPSGTYTAHGTCAYDGTNELWLSNTNLVYFSQYPQTSGDFTITCSGHVWSQTITIGQGIETLTLIDLHWLGNIVSHWQSDLESNLTQNVYHGFLTNVGYSLQLSYPECTNNFCNNLKASSDWIFRFGYTVPSGTPLNTVSFTLGECNSSYADCVNEINDYISVLDSSNNGYVDTSIADILVENDTRHYYRSTIELHIGTGVTVKYAVLFSTLGSTDSGALPEKPPDQAELGFWGNLVRSLVVPSQQSMQQFTDISDRMKTKAPFAYFYDTQNRVTNLNTNASSLVIMIPMHFNGVNMDMTVMDSGEEHVANVFNTLRPYMILVIWLSVVAYFYERIKHQDL